MVVRTESDSTHLAGDQSQAGSLGDSEPSGKVVTRAKPDSSAGWWTY